MYRKSSWWVVETSNMGYDLKLAQGKVNINLRKSYFIDKSCWWLVQTSNTGAWLANRKVNVNLIYRKSWWLEETSSRGREAVNSNMVGTNIDLKGAQSMDYQVFSCHHSSMFLSYFHTSFWTYRGAFIPPSILSPLTLSCHSHQYARKHAECRI